MQYNTHADLEKLIFPKTFILFDLEYTAWDGSYKRNWSGKNEHREIIQMGAIRVQGSDLSEEMHLGRYVKPTINPVLSDFIVSFTGIAQSDVDIQGVSFKKILEEFQHAVGDLPAYCWGRDIEVLKENCNLNSILMPSFFAQLKNLKPILAPVFASVGIDIAQYTSGTLISAFTVTGESRRAHDALNDMRNFLDALRALKARLEKKEESY